jgi:hypothetical protein
LDVTERHAGVESGGDKRMTQDVGSDPLGDPRPAGDAAHGPAGRVAIDPVAVGPDEDRPVAAFADRQIDGPRRPRCEEHGHDLAAFARDGKRAVVAFEPQVLDVGADGFGDA